MASTDSTPVAAPGGAVGAAAAPAPAISQVISAAPDEVGKKVFVGNLAFATTAEELKSIFGGVGPIKDSHIITRNTRSLGYGFVTFESTDDATTAIQKFDKHQVNDRTINVELAKPARADKVAKAAAKAAGLTAPAAEGEGHGGKKGRKPKRAPRPDGEADGTVDGAPVEAGAGVGKPKKRRNKVKQALKDAVDGVATAGATAVGTTAAGAAPASTAAGAGRQRRTREPRAKTVQGPPSDNKIFVANLPFAVDNAALAKFFTDAGFEPQHVRIATRRVYPKAPKVEGELKEGEEKPKRPAPFNKSKGFAFVTLKDKSQQEKALKELDGKEIKAEGEEGRTIQLKIANERVEEEEGTTAEGTETKLAPQPGTEVAAV